MEEAGAQPVCAQEALALLNCVTQSPFDQEKCIRLLHSLRQCVLDKNYLSQLHKMERLPAEQMSSLAMRQWREC
ncbi:hypothetical protein QQP08_009374 [Theobroma cacao]|nr:hypothetical protein QQP08_009374 [Theobroma cacao]